MKAAEFLIWMRDHKRVPGSRERHGEMPSNSEIHRWVRNGSVSVDGMTLEAQGVVEFPVREIVFFPKSKSRVTMPGFGE